MRPDTTIVLAGGAEFGGRMADVDRRALALAGGLAAPVVIIPTAAAPDNNHRRAGGNGVRWFRGLGATNVTVVPLVDRESADDPTIAATLAGASLVYLLGGFTHYLGRTLHGSRSAAALARAADGGAVIAGSSAGAMVLCDRYYNPGDGKLYPGLGFVAPSVVLPHHNTFGRRWAGPLGRQAADATLLGIDERTGMIGRDGTWEVVGAGAVTLYAGGERRVVAVGEPFRL